MWGKIGQRSNMMQVKEFSDPPAFWQFNESEKIEVRYVSVIDEEKVEVHFKNTKEDVEKSPNLNVFVAAFTTCWARLHLYATLDRLGERVLYMDTDSFIFTALPGEDSPPLGSYLGQFKNEIKPDKKTGQEDYIVEFVTGGPKNYAYRTKHGKIDCKVRGFTLNSKGLEQLNFTVVKNNVLQEIQQPLEDHKVREKEVKKAFHIVRDSKKYTLSTVEQTKKYRLVFDKRVVDPSTFKTYPYGCREY